MHVHLFDQRTLRITNMGNAYDRLSALTGATYDKPSKSLLVPLCHLRCISQMRPVVIDHACIAARLDLWRRWVQQHNAWGIWFAYADDGQTVVPVSDDGELSPVFIEHVADRSAIIEQFLDDQVIPAQAARKPVVSVEPTSGEALLMRSIAGAARREECKAEIVGRAKGKRRSAKQMSLLEE